jgi:hypothetical protein
MGLLTVVEDRPTPKAVYNWRVWACASVASFASCMIGYDRYATRPTVVHKQIAVD